MSRIQNWLISAVALGLATAASGCVRGANRAKRVRRPPTPSSINPPRPTRRRLPASTNFPRKAAPLAEKQMTCPVTDEPLGGMGKPVKLTVKGQVVFLCCEGCRAEFNRNQEKYLKKVTDHLKKNKDAK